ncbi:GntR family transcriptional regulator [Hydrogenispora ethanolica]|uniref:GntR family transcriptional regulator n=1 Tax=Hydrogenispora ethanolica TaxID=1082276 RepID=A0A4R1R0K8_HYDET|nr:GntR family transcriptional regulator [Hydrogenispora ethanolica]
MLDEKAPVALYYQLKEILVDKIKSNEWQIDSKIPTERELCDLYKVSRITVRQALEELENEGLLYRKQGKGTFVTAPKIEQRLSKFYSFSEEIRNMGYTPSTKVIEFKKLAIDESIAKHFTEKESEVYYIRRLRLANNEPFAIETSYIPFDLCPGLTMEEVSGKGLYNTMKTKYGIIPNEAVETFEAVIINPNDALHLRVGKNSPGLLLERTTYANQRMVEFCHGVIRGDRYKYRVVLK